jgi:hypothetical protein
MVKPAKEPARKISGRAAVTSASADQLDASAEMEIKKDGHQRCGEGSFDRNSRREENGRNDEKPSPHSEDSGQEPNQKPSHDQFPCTQDAEVRQSLRGAFAGQTHEHGVGVGVLQKHHHANKEHESGKGDKRDLLGQGCPNPRSEWRSQYSAQPDDPSRSPHHLTGSGLEDGPVKSGQSYHSERYRHGRPQRQPQAVKQQRNGQDGTPAPGQAERNSHE